MESNIDLQLSSYDYELPTELIASRPATGRHNSKLLVYDVKQDKVIHTHFHDIHNFLPEDSLLVLNQSKVFPCRIICQKSSGGKAEIFVLSVVEKDSGYEAMVKCRGKKNVGDKFVLPFDESATIIKVLEGKFIISFSVENIVEYLDRVGKIPIPPYIRGGESDETDKDDYQTVFAKNVGSVAAPTAGLHFTDEVFDNLSSKGIERAHVTLHVGLGTFLPVKEDDLRNHKMHTEEFFVDQENLKKLKTNQKRFCVGTTSLRVLESSYQDGEFKINPEQRYETDIFLHPGVNVQSISGLITNFHLPKSTLLMLVSSLIGREKTLELYHEAIEKKYRFFSYGDSMLIIR